MQIQYTKNLNPGRFELGTTLSWPNRSKPMHKICRCQIYCSQTRLLVVLHRSCSNEMYQKAWYTCRIVVVVLVFLFCLWKLFSWPSSLWLFKLAFQEVEHSGIQVLPVPFFFENRALVWNFPKASGRISLSQQTVKSNNGTTCLRRWQPKTVTKQAANGPLR